MHQAKTAGYPAKNKLMKLVLAIKTFQLENIDRFGSSTESFEVKSVGRFVAPPSQ